MPGISKSPGDEAENINLWRGKPLLHNRVHRCQVLQNRGKGDKAMHFVIGAIRVLGIVATYQDDKVTHIHGVRVGQQGIGDGINVATTVWDPLTSNPAAKGLAGHDTVRGDTTNQRVTYYKESFFSNNNGTSPRKNVISRLSFEDTGSPFIVMLNLGPWRIWFSFYTLKAIIVRPLLAYPTGKICIYNM